MAWTSQALAFDQIVFRFFDGKHDAAFCDTDSISVSLEQLDTDGLVQS
jgi:hypothetical protein